MNRYDHHFHTLCRGIIGSLGSPQSWRISICVSGRIIQSENWRKSDENRLPYSFLILIGFSLAPSSELGSWNVSLLRSTVTWELRRKDVGDCGSKFSIRV